MLKNKTIRATLLLYKRYHEYLKTDMTLRIPELEKDLTKYQMIPDVGESISIAEYTKFVNVDTEKEVGPFPIGRLATVYHRTYTPRTGTVDLNIMPINDYKAENEGTSELRTVNALTTKAVVRNTRLKTSMKQMK